MILLNMVDVVVVVYSSSLNHKIQTCLIKKLSLINRALETW